MNVRKLQLELMRAILRSSDLQYDDAYPIVKSVAPQLANHVSRLELEIEQKKLEELRKKKELEEQRRKNESQKPRAGSV